MFGKSNLKKVNKRQRSTGKSPTTKRSYNFWQATATTRTTTATTTTATTKGNVNEKQA